LEATTIFSPAEDGDCAAAGRMAANNMAAAARKTRLKRGKDSLIFDLVWG
jgi:hypothetical protein